MKRLLPEEVNKRNSITWTACNDDSRSAFWRSTFKNQYGGEFFKEGRGWVWKENKPVEIPRRCWVFMLNNEEVKITNFSEYCANNSLQRSAMYEVMQGKRKQYKGYTFLAEEIHGLRVIKTGHDKLDKDI
jgi:hypothetical protein